MFEETPAGRRSKSKRPGRTVVKCAWCHMLSITGTWHRPPAWARLLAGRGRRISHGICPDCFAELAPGVPYPQD